MQLKKELTTMLAISIPLFIVLGLIYAIKSLISVKQLNDQVSKTQVKKIYLATVALGVVVLVLAFLMILWAVGII